MIFIYSIIVCTLGIPIHDVCYSFTFTFDVVFLPVMDYRHDKTNKFLPIYYT